MEKTGTNKRKAALWCLVMAYLFISMLLIKFSTMYIKGISDQACSRMVEIFGLVFGLVLLRTGMIKPANLGLRLTKTQALLTLRGSGVICLSMLLVFVLTRIVLGTVSPEVAQRPWLKLYLGINGRYMSLVVAFIQEFLSKGVLYPVVKQAMGEEADSGKDRNMIAVCLIVSAVFGTLHFYRTFWYMIGAFVLSFATCLIYHRERNIWGCTAIHFIGLFVPRMIGIIAF